MGQLEFDLYTMEVECPPVGPCVGADSGVEVEPESVFTWGFVSTVATSDPDRPHGLFVHGEGTLSGGGQARLTLEIPESSDAELRARYEETRPNDALSGSDGQERVFVSEQFQGRIRVPRDLLGENCDCADGSFDLQFEDGQDVRRLTLGRFGWSEGSFCVSAGRIAPMTEHASVERFSACRIAFAESPPNRPPPTRTESSPPPSEERATCDSGASCESDSSSDSGCESDTSSGSSSSSCEGDSSSDTSCEGDDSSGSSDCSGDDSSSDSCEGDSSSVRALPLSSGRFQLAALLALVFLRIRRKSAR